MLSAFDNCGTASRRPSVIMLIIAAVALVIASGTSSTGALPFISGVSGDILPLSRKPHQLPRPQPDQSDAGLAKGKLLVASRNLQDPRFQETVILLVSYNNLGAVGLVINRPTTVSLSEALSDVPWLRKRKDAMYYGGPVEGHRILLLIRSDSKPEESSHVFDGVYVSSSLTALKGMIEHAKRGEHVRGYAGYAGWAAGQLDWEVSRGDWYVFHADVKTIFEKKHDEIWPELIRRGAEIQVWNSRRLLGEL